MIVLFDCSIRVSQFFKQNVISCIQFGQLLTFIAHPTFLILEYKFQPVVTSFASIALIMRIMMMTIGASGS